MDVLTALQRIDSSLVYAVNNLFEPDLRLFELVDEARAFLVDASQNQVTANDRWRLADLAQPGSDPVAALESSPWVEGTWAEGELERVVLVFPHVETSVHENNFLVQQVANFLGRKTRSVEAQLLMCRNLQRDNQYPWGNMNRLIPEIWERRNEIWEHGLAGVHPDGTINADYVPSTPGNPPISGEPTHAESEGEPPASVSPQPESPFSPGDRVASNDGVLNGTVSWCWNNGTVEVRLDDGETRIFTCTALTLADQQDEIVDAAGEDSTDTQVIETPADTGKQLEDDMVDPPPSPPQGSNDGHGESRPFSRLLERAFGGQDVAISPADEMDPFWPVGPSAVGTNDVCERLIQHLRSANSGDTAEWVFLVGGAGNGKSFLANHVVKEAGCELISNVREGLADRVYLFSTANDRTFRLVNDATIPPENAETGLPPFLCSDLNQAIDHEQDLLACVNRGILIGERHELGEPQAALGDQQGLLASLIQWLIDPSHLAAAEDNEESTAFELRLVGEENDQNSGPLDGYYAQAELLSSGAVTANIHLLNMDYASLFEPNPLQDGHSLRWHADTGQATAARYTMLSHRRDKGRRQESPAFHVISSLVDKFDAVEVDQDNDPLLANLSMMRNEEIRESLVEILRSVEIVTGHRFTYRELWGVLCIALIGYVRPEFRTTGEDAVAPEDWHQQHSHALQENGDELFAFASAAMQRSHMSLFGGQVPELKAWRNLDRLSPSFPSASRWVTEIDPATDAVPEWAEVVHEAMMSIQVSEDHRPSQYLIDREPSFEASWHGFDDHLEGLVLAKIQHEKTSDTDRRLLQSWFGSYLLRLYGLSLGIPAFSSTIGEWTENWKAAQARHPLTEKFRDGLVTLLTGKSSANQQSVYLPWLAPRTTPLGDSSKATIVTEFREEQFRHFEMHTQGDTLSLSLQELGGISKNQSHEIIVDFSLCRDAICCSSKSLGFTDQSHKTAPRLERMRAALMSEAHVRKSGQATQRPRHGVLDGDRFLPFE